MKTPIILIIIIIGQQETKMLSTTSP